MRLFTPEAMREADRKAVERARILLQNDVIGSAELQRRETELALADLATVDKQLQKNVKLI